MIGHLVTARYVLDLHPSDRYWKTGDPGWVNPNGQFSSYNAGTSCAYPPGFPKNKAGCPGGSGTANDSSGLWLQIRTPTNATGFSFEAIVGRDELIGRELTALVDKMGGASLQPLLTNLVRVNGLTAKELRELLELVDDLDRQKKAKKKRD